MQFFYKASLAVVNVDEVVQFSPINGNNDEDDDDFSWPTTRDNSMDFSEPAWASKTQQNPILKHESVLPMPKLGSIFYEDENILDDIADIEDNFNDFGKYLAPLSKNKAVQNEDPIPGLLNVTPQIKRKTTVKSNNLFLSPAKKSEEPISSDFPSSPFKIHDNWMQICERYFKFEENQDWYGETFFEKLTSEDSGSKNDNLKATYKQFIQYTFKTLFGKGFNAQSDLIISSNTVMKNFIQLNVQNEWPEDMTTFVQTAFRSRRLKKGVQFQKQT